jgi:hypothetical protein
MKTTARTGAVGLALMCAAAISAQERKPATGIQRPQARPASTVRPVEVQTSVSRTAVWVGDRVVFTVEFRRAPNVEIFMDDLAPERLRLEGLEVLDTSTERDSSASDRVIDRMKYTLATYNVESETLGIAPIPVRYSVRSLGQKAEDALPAGELIVPALHLALRSTITPSGDAVQIRDQRAVRPLPRRIRYAEMVGWTLLALSAVPVLLWVIRMVQRARRARPKRVSRPPLRRRVAALEEIRDAAVSTPAARRAAYVKLDAWIRENVPLAGGAPASALTPDEVVTALADSKSVEWRQQLERVLLECEQAKYGVDLPPADRWPAVVEESAQLTLARSIV